MRCTRSINKQRPAWPPAIFSIVIVPFVIVIIVAVIAPALALALSFALAELALLAFTFALAGFVFASAFLASSVSV